ncbi:MAG: type III pantothenate kinase [Bacteroidales bacterium]|nr:type III pantothenate kinase [Bacteroidales bacterium]
MGRVILAIDRGNTKDKFAIFEQDKICFSDTAECLTSEILEKIIREYHISDIIFSSVRNESENSDFMALLKSFDVDELKNILLFDRDFALPFVNSYIDKHSVGLDRLAAVAGVQHIYGANTLLIDAGTCITFDYLDKDNIYQGGSISLGLQSKYKALHNFTANLPLINSIRTASLTSKTTEECIVSGVINGTLFELEGRIDAYAKKYCGLKVVFTGGDAMFLHDNIDRKTFYEKDIVLYGLKKIFDLNAEKI